MQRKGSVVVVLGTGGTIAGRAATAAEHLDYRSAQLGVGELLASVAGAPLQFVVEGEQVAQLDSKDMDFATWRALAARVELHAARPEVAGVVVTHGTDTVEETAWFLARVVVADRPIALTAAMRPASSLAADGPRNLADAIAWATAGGPAGVVAVMAGEVHDARDVRKSHPQRLAALSSGERGPLGRIEGGRIDVLRAAAAVGNAIGLDRLPEAAQRWPWVEIVTSAAGADGRVVDLLCGAGVDGIVVAATGNGSVHRDLEAALARAAERGVAVLRSSRCLDGAIVDGGAVRWPSAGDLTPVKARIELVLQLLARTP